MVNRRKQYAIKKQHVNKNKTLAAIVKELNTVTIEDVSDTYECPIGLNRPSSVRLSTSLDEDWMKCTETPTEFISDISRTPSIPSLSSQNQLFDGNTNSPTAFSMSSASPINRTPFQRRISPRSLKSMARRMSCLSATSSRLSTSSMPVDIDKLLATKTPPVVFSKNKIEAMNVTNFTRPTRPATGQDVSSGTPTERKYRMARFASEKNQNVMIKCSDEGNKDAQSNQNNLDATNISDNRLRCPTSTSICPSVRHEDLEGIAESQSQFKFSPTRPLATTSATLLEKIKDGIETKSSEMVKRFPTTRPIGVIAPVKVRHDICSNYDDESAPRTKHTTKSSDPSKFERPTDFKKEPPKHHTGRDTTKPDLAQCTKHAHEEFTQQTTKHTPHSSSQQTTRHGSFDPNMPSCTKHGQPDFAYRTMRHESPDSVHRSYTKHGHPNLDHQTTRHSVESTQQTTKHLYPVAHHTTKQTQPDLAHQTTKHTSHDLSYQTTRHAPSDPNLPASTKHGNPDLTRQTTRYTPSNSNLSACTKHGYPDVTRQTTRHAPSDPNVPACTRHGHQDLTHQSTRHASSDPNLPACTKHGNLDSTHQTTRHIPTDPNFSACTKHGYPELVHQTTRQPHANLAHQACTKHGHPDLVHHTTKYVHPGTDQACTKHGHPNLGRETCTKHTVIEKSTTKQFLESTEYPEYGTRTTTEHVDSTKREVIRPSAPVRYKSPKHLMKTPDSMRSSITPKIDFSKGLTPKQGVKSPDSAKMPSTPVLKREPSKSTTSERKAITTERVTSKMGSAKEITTKSTTPMTESVTRKRYDSAKTTEKRKELQARSSSRKKDLTTSQKVSPERGPDKDDSKKSTSKPSPKSFLERRQPRRNQDTPRPRLLSSVTPFPDDKCRRLKPLEDGRVLSCKERALLSFRYGYPMERIHEFSLLDIRKPSKMILNKASKLRIACSRKRGIIPARMHRSRSSRTGIDKTAGEPVIVRIIKPKPPPKVRPYSVEFKYNKSMRLRYLVNHLPPILRRRYGVFEELYRSPRKQVGYVKQKLKFVVEELEKDTQSAKDDHSHSKRAALHADAHKGREGNETKESLNLKRMRNKELMESRFEKLKKEPRLPYRI